MNNSVKELLIKTRSIRRFDADCKLSDREVEDLIDAARFCPSGGNKQPLVYFYVNTEKEIAFLMKHLHFAALLKEWAGPEEKEYPSACILILIDKEIASSAGYDSGIAAQAILMAAAERELGGCMLGNIGRKEIAEHYGLDSERYAIDLAVVVGKPAEQVVLTEAVDGKTAYWRGTDDVHYVPKRSLKDVCIGRA